jgi:hypothetical protein
MKRKSRCLLAIVAFVAIGTSCSSWNDDRGRGDSPVGKRHEAPRQIWFGPDRYHNVAAWCIGANGVYAHTRSGAPPVVIANDPNCEEGGILYES